jgi:hypothetical protein
MPSVGLGARTPERGQALELIVVEVGEFVVRCRDGSHEGRSWPDQKLDGSARRSRALI